MTEAIPLWKTFPREIECDLSLYHNVDIGDWHTGKMSSRKLLVLLAGLPADSWYRTSAHQYLEEARAEKEHLYKREIQGLIYAQLTGQNMEVADDA